MAMGGHYFPYTNRNL